MSARTTSGVTCTPKPTSQVLGKAHEASVYSIGFDTANKLLEDGAWLPAADGTFARPEDAQILQKVADTMLELLGLIESDRERLITSLRLASSKSDQPTAGTGKSSPGSEEGSGEATAASDRGHHKPTTGDSDDSETVSTASLRNIHSTLYQ